MPIHYVKVKGWGFERPKSDPSPFSVKVRSNSSGTNAERIVENATVFTSRYELQIDLDKLKLGTDDVEIAFSENQAIYPHVMQVKHVIPPEPLPPTPVPPPKSPGA